MAKPSSQINWTTDNATPGDVRVEPSGSKKETGWFASERPAFEHMNWVLWNLDQWVKYFEEVTDAYIGFQSIYDAFVGSSGLATHATINDAMADVPAGGRILVLESATINTVQSISKNRVRIDFQPGVIFTKGTAANALQVQADYVQIHGGEFLGFSGGSDSAILIDAGSSFCKVRDGHFRTCTTSVTDNAGDASILGITEET